MFFRILYSQFLYLLFAGMQYMYEYACRDNIIFWLTYYIFVLLIVTTYATPSHFSFYTTFRYSIFHFYSQIVIGVCVYTFVKIVMRAFVSHMQYDEPLIRRKSLLKIKNRNFREKLALNQIIHFKTVSISNFFFFVLLLLYLPVMIMTLF